MQEEEKLAQINEQCPIKDVLTYCGITHGAGPKAWQVRCFHPKQRIVADGKVILAEEVKIGDMLVQSNTLGKVKDVRKTKYSQPWVKLTIKRLNKLPVYLSLDSPVWAMNIKTGVEGWVKVNQLTKDYFVQIVWNSQEKDRDYWSSSIGIKENGRWCLNERQRIYGGGLNVDWKLEKEVLEFIGLYTAEGNTYKDGNIRIASHEREVEYRKLCERAIQIMGVKNEWVLRDSIKNGKATKGKYIQIGNRLLQELLDESVGKLAYKKMWGDWLLKLPKDKVEYLLRGFQKGDGGKCFIDAKKIGKKTNQEHVYWATSSENLACQIFGILLRLGYAPAIRSQDKTYVTKEAKLQYEISLKGEEFRKWCKELKLPYTEAVNCCVWDSYVRKGQNLYYRVHNVELEEGLKEKIEIEMEGDETLNAFFVKVHNCPFHKGGRETKFSARAYRDTNRLWCYTEDKQYRVTDIIAHTQGVDERGIIAWAEQRFQIDYDKPLPEHREKRDPVMEELEKKMRSHRGKVQLEEYKKVAYVITRTREDKIDDAERQKRVTWVEKQLKEWDG